MKELINIMLSALILLIPIAVPLSVSAEQYSSEYTRKWAAQREEARRRGLETERRAAQARNNQQNIQKFFAIADDSDEALLNQPVPNSYQKPQYKKPAYRAPAVNPLCMCRDEQGVPFYGMMGSDCNTTYALRNYTACENGGYGQ